MMRIRFTKRFLKDLKHLSKKQPLVRSDVDDFIATLGQGEHPGDRLQGTDDQAVYKARLSISGSNRGKSAGYRLIYWVYTAEGIVLLTIYAKNERSDISANDVNDILAEALIDLDIADGDDPDNL